MIQTSQTLLEQMQFSEFEAEHRKSLFLLSEIDVEALKKVKPVIDAEMERIVTVFYQMQTNVPEIALLIGDADTLSRLQIAQRRYVLDLFSGVYDLEYINNRLRIGIVHKRIGVEPKLYLSAIYTLKSLLSEVITTHVEDVDLMKSSTMALEKLLYFDITLVFDTYIRSLLSEIEISKNKSDQYALDLEERVKTRTSELVELSRSDPLTGLLNVRHLQETLLTVLRAAQRRSEPVSFIYIDVNDFKIVNDTLGHQAGDDILCTVAKCIQGISRQEDSCFRYGGDEFCIILPNCTKAAAKENYKSRLIEEIKARPEEISLSIGIAETGPEDYLEPDALIAKADKEMYEEKNRRKLERQPQ
ncbi:MAG: GGDEF domain-containing protein [Gammaproteobacteria bacterium]|nr:GGDEF domain-containing protein [Gammaproteobacteria bacterium]